MLRQYSQEEKSIIAGAELALNWHLGLLRKIDSELPSILLVEYLELEAAVASKTIPEEPKVFGQT